MKTVEYKVLGMSCGGCAASVKRVLSRNKAITEVEVEQMDQLVTVTYNELDTSDEVIIDTLGRIGYKAEVK